MTTFTSWPPDTMAMADGVTPVVSNKKILRSEPVKTFGTQVTSNRTVSTSSTTSSLSSISSSGVSSQGSHFSTMSPSIQFSPASSFHPVLPRRSTQTTFFPKTRKLVSRSPQPVIMYTRDRTYRPKRKTSASRIGCKSSPLDFLSDLIVNACRMDRCAGEELDGIYEEESIMSEYDNYSYLDVYEASVESESYIDDSLGTQSIASSQTPLQSNEMYAKRASLSSTFRSKSLIDSADGNSLIDSTAISSGKSLIDSTADELGYRSEESEAVTGNSLLLQALSARNESRVSMADIADRYYKKLSTVGIRLFLNEQSNALEPSRKTPGLLFLRLGQTEEDPHLLWVALETKKSNIFSVFDVISIGKLNFVDNVDVDNPNAVESSRFCISLKDDDLLFFEAIDETQMTRVVKVLQVVVARYTRALILGDRERLGQILQKNNVAVTGESMASLTDNLVANCFAKK